MPATVDVDLEERIAVLVDERATLLGKLGTEAKGKASGESALACGSVRLTTIGREHVLNRQREQRA